MPVVVPSDANQCFCLFNLLLYVSYSEKFMHRCQRHNFMYFYDTNSPRSAWRLQPRWNWIFLLDRCFFRPLRVRISEQKVEDHLFCVKQESRFSFSPKSMYGIKFVVHIWFWRSGIFPVRHLQSLEFFMSPMFEIRLFKRHRIRIEIKWWGDH